MQNICNLSNMAIKVNGHNFKDIDEGTREAIVGDLASLLMIPYDTAENIAKCLYYEAYQESGELRVKYSIPEILARNCLKI